jgi:energy-coupling factor transporter ATP-binding protein EcfA2
MQSFRPAFYIKQIQFGSGSPYAGMALDLQPFTVISGLHGAGKSTLLTFISESMNRGSGYYSDGPPYVGYGRHRHVPNLIGRQHLGGRITLLVQESDAERSFETDLDIDGSDDEVVEFNPIAQNPYTVSSDIQIFFQDVDVANPLDRAVGEPEVQKRADLDALRDILGVSYDEVTYHPVDADGSGYVFPYTVARKAGAVYDSFSMSYGENVVHKLRWEMRHAKPNSVFFLDEPDAHIAPRGRAALLDEMARLARASGSQVIMTTHSPEIISRIPLEAVKICVRVGDRRHLLEPSKPADLRDVLGIEHPLRFLLFVEDRIARALLEMIFGVCKFPFMAESEVIETGSWSDVIVAHSAMRSSSRLRSVAVLDGDQAGKVPSSKRVEGTFFLPGDQPPEKVVIEYAAQRPERFAEVLGCAPHAVNIYLGEVFGAEHHRWVDILARRSGYDWRHCLKSAFQVWFEDPENEATAEALTRSIVEAFNTASPG